MPFDLITDIEQLRKLIEEENTVEISKLLDQLHPADIAELMEDLTTDEAKFVFMLLDGEQASDVLVEIPEADRKRFLKALPPEFIASKFIEFMDSDDAADVVADEVLKNAVEVTTREQIAEIATVSAGDRQIGEKNEAIEGFNADPEKVARASTSYAQLKRQRDAAAAAGRDTSGFDHNLRLLEAEMRRNSPEGLGDLQRERDALIQRRDGSAVKALGAGPVSHGKYSLTHDQRATIVLHCSGKDF